MRPDCGAVVLFSGTVRDHAEGRGRRAPRPTRPTRKPSSPRLAAIAAEARRAGRARPDRLLHRIGRLDVGESSVAGGRVRSASPEAFEAARYAIDALKASVPIWKHETWRDGSAWGTGATPISGAGTVA